MRRRGRGREKHAGAEAHSRSETTKPEGARSHGALPLVAPPPFAAAPVRKARGGQRQSPHCQCHSGMDGSKTFSGGTGRHGSARPSGRLPGAGADKCSAAPPAICPGIGGGGAPSDAARGQESALHGVGADARPAVPAPVCPGSCRCGMLFWRRPAELVGATFPGASAPGGPAPTQAALQFRLAICRWRARQSAQRPPRHGARIATDVRAALPGASLESAD